MEILAEREGFEPSVAAKATTVFETAPIVHSGTSPILQASIILDINEGINWGSAAA